MTTQVNTGTTDITNVGSTTFTGSTASNVLANILSLAITAPTNNSTYQITWSATTTAGAALTGEFDIFFDGLLLDNVQVDHSTVTTDINTQLFCLNEGVAAGSHTILVQWLTTASTITIGAAAPATLTVVVTGNQ